MPIQPAQDLVVAGRFRLSRLIGRGGMGSVWMATHLGLDVPCAVKFIEGEGADMPEVHARFEREAKAAAQLRSPHVVQILDHGVWEGTPYIAMELLDGEDLGKRLGRVGRLAPHELIVILSQVCRALSKAHALGIVHRDLKPDNIFLVRDDDREIAKILDFGIAKATGAGVVGSSTRTGAMLGTPYYMSPEQAQGTRAVDSRSDLWALAVIVFEALTGRRPFESEALGDLLMRIIVGPIPTPTAFAPDLPPALDAWWARGAQRDPAQRFQSARELCDSLSLVFGRASGEAGDPSQPLGSQAFGRAPQPSTPNAQFGGLAPPPYGQTPGHGQAPAIHAQTPGHGPAAQAPEASPRHAAPSNPQGPGYTEAGVARTFGDKPASPPRRAGILMGVAAGIVVLGGAAVAVSVAFRSRGEEPAQGRQAATSESAGRPPFDEAGAPVRLAPPSPPGSPASEPSSPSVSAALAPNAPTPPVEPAAPAPAASPLSRGAAEIAPPTRPSHGQPAAATTPARRPPPAVVAPPPPATPAKPAEEPKRKTVDLGI